MFLLYIILGLLGIKLLYNLTVPYELLRLHDPAVGISVMIAIEWLLLGVALILSFILKPEVVWLDFWPLLGIGTSLIIATYMHFVLAMIIGGWLISKSKQ